MQTLNPRDVEVPLPSRLRVPLSDAGFVFTFAVHTHLCSLLNIFSLRTLCNLNLFFTVNAHLFFNLTLLFFACDLS